MNVGFDKPRQHKPAIDPFAWRRIRQSRFDGGNAAVLDTDIDGGILASGDAALVQDEIEGHGYCAASLRPR